MEIRSWEGSCAIRWVTRTVRLVAFACWPCLVCACLDGYHSEEGEFAGCQSVRWAESRIRRQELPAPAQAAFSFLALHASGLT